MILWKEETHLNENSEERLQNKAKIKMKENWEENKNINQN